MTNYENAHTIFNNTKKKMVGKLIQVHQSEFALTKTEGFGMIGCFWKNVFSSA